MTSKYNLVHEEIDALNVSIKEKIIYALIAAVIGILLIMGPIAILINLLIFIDIKPFIYFLMALMVILFCYIVDRIYLKLITKGKVKDISVIYIQDTFIDAFVILGFLLIIIELGVL